MARHPLPDRRGLLAAAEVEALARGLGRDDLLLVLLSGGASALLPAPVAGVSLEDKVAVTSALLRAGATIGELNTVRKHLSRLKGGGLARAAGPPASSAWCSRTWWATTSSTIASGPTVPDPTTFAEALEVLRRRQRAERGAAAPCARHLEAGAAGERPETPKPRDRGLPRGATRIVGSNRLSVEAAAREARQLGLRALVLTTFLEGEAREVARVLVSVLRECVESGTPGEPPVCLLAGGETTVTVRGDGRGRPQPGAGGGGGRSAGRPSRARGGGQPGHRRHRRRRAAPPAASPTQDSLRRAAQLGLAPPAVFLDASDSAGFLAPLGDLIVTGPTGTNVVDLTVLLAGDPAASGLTARL